MQQTAEETLREVGPRGQGSSSHAQEAKSDPLPPALGGSHLAGKGDERVAATISTPRDGLRHMLTDPCCSAPSGLLLLLPRRRGAAPKPCTGPPEGLLEGRVLQDTQGFAY